MSRYRKKPVEIEAVRFFSGNYGDAKRFCPDLQLIREAASNKIAYGLIPTLEGTMRADVGDWIIQGVQGEFYPCKPDIFDATYEPVSGQDPTEEQP